MGAARAACERRVSAGAPHLRRGGAAPAAPRARRAASRVLRSGRGGDGARPGHGHLPALGADEAGAGGVGRPHLGAAGRRRERRAAGLRRGRETRRAVIIPARRSAAKPTTAPTASATPARIASFPVLTPRPSATPAPANAPAVKDKSGTRDCSASAQAIAPRITAQTTPWPAIATPPSAAMSTHTTPETVATIVFCNPATTPPDTTK